MRPAEGYLKFYFDGLGRNADNTKAAAAPQPKNIQLSAEPGMSNMTASQMTDSRAPAAVTAAGTLLSVICQAVMFDLSGSDNWMFLGCGAAAAFVLSVFLPKPSK